MTMAEVTQQIHDNGRSDTSNMWQWLKWHIRYVTVAEVTQQIHDNGRSDTSNMWQWLKRQLLHAYLTTLYKPLSCEALISSSPASLYSPRPECSGRNWPAA